MNILFVQKIAGIAGSERYFFKILNGISESGNSTYFLAITHENDRAGAQQFLDYLDKLGIKHHQIIYNSASVFSLIFKIKKFIDKHQFDLVQSNLIHADFFLGIAKLICKHKFKLVSAKHGYDEKFTRDYGYISDKTDYSFYRFICKIAEKFIDKSFAVSNGVKDLYIQQKISKPKNIETIYHGFHISESKYNPERKKYLLVLGRLVKCKGLFLVLDIFKLIQDKIPDYKLKFVGSGPLLNELKQYAESLNITKYVEFVGFVEDVEGVEGYIKNARLMIIPTKGEGFGNVFVEAAQNHIPIVAFDVPAGNEILQNKKTALLIKPFDKIEFAELIVHLIKDEALQESLAENAYQHVKENFNYETMLASTLDFYNRAVNK